jgi:hypothetical protein
MSEKDFLLAEKISAEVHKLVNKMTKNLKPDGESDYAIRQHLTETFRFWRR